MSCTSNAVHLVPIISAHAATEQVVDSCVGFIVRIDFELYAAGKTPPMTAVPRLDAEALPVVLRQSVKAKLKASWLAALFGFLAVVVATTVVTERPDDGGAIAAGALVVGVAAPLFLYWALQLVPGSCRLRVTPDGIDARHCFVTRRRSWHELERFYTRTYTGYRMPVWTGVAFSHRGQEHVGVASFLEHVLRVRGIFRTDLLPDTYGVEPKELAAFLNECRVRWAGDELGDVPERIAPTRPVAVFALLLLAVVTAFLALAAVGAVAAGDWGGAALTLLFACPVAYALFAGIRKWRRGGLGLSPRER